jgi:PIN domain nuclease of toxin-antitoxin system
MKLETLCWAIAIVGMILTGIGRRLIIIEARSISTGWTWAVRLLPLADIMFLARFWDSAKVGAFTSLAGLMCFLPLGGKTLWDKKHRKPDAAPELSRKLNGDEKNELYVEMKAIHEMEIEHRKQKLEQLNAHMSAWYANMTQRRESLTTATPEQVEAFNGEAAAYQSLHQVTKEEAATLQKLLDRNMSSWSVISDADYAEYVLHRAEHFKRFSRAMDKHEADPFAE